jgi:ABC-type protease/lipase transport system fused ATPase/permease subunit
MNQVPVPARQQPASSELAAALGACRRAFVATAMFSGMSNLLMLTGALFMLEVYDRILPSRSVPTLVALLILVAGLYAVQGMIDTIRSRIMIRVGRSLDESMSTRVYDAIVRLPLKIGAKGDGTRPMRDLDTCAAFSPEADRLPSSICRGCRSISRCAFCSTLISDLPHFSAP